MRSIPAILAAVVLWTTSWANHIYVSGVVSGTWAVDTVFVIGEIQVPVGQELIIQSGVRVIFQGHYKFIISGTLEAIGTATDSIRFFATDAATGWHGMRFLNASEASRIEYCVLTNGKATGSGPDAYGGAIYCDGSNPQILFSRLTGNQAQHSGGAIWCTSGSHPLIETCSVTENTSSVYGGGIGTWEAAPVIHNGFIGDNTAGDDGGGVFSYQSQPSVSYCVIERNTAVEWGGGLCIGWQSTAELFGLVVTENTGGDGGGIYGYHSDFSVSGSLISGNTTAGGGGVYSHHDGGGIFLGYSAPSNLILQNCLVTRNIALRHGGGLYFGSACGVQASGNFFLANISGQYGGGLAAYGSATFSLSHNAWIGNHAGTLGGALFCFNYAPYFLDRNTLADNQSDSATGGWYVVNNPGQPARNLIFWDNAPAQIGYMTAPVVAYSDVQNSWPGLGNINQYPAFLDTGFDDYRLQWGSSCLNSGDPDSLDPDGTRTDMGAFYFDQSVPARVLLTPHQIPYLIPAGGGSLNFTLRLDNWTASPQTVTAWCNVTLPDSSVYGPLVGPVTVTVAAHTMLARVRTQTIPAYAPLGVYRYNAYTVVEGDTSKDSFMFGKLGDSGQAGMTTGWANTGEDFAVERTADQNLLPFSFCLLPSQPNPFNPTTALSYTLQATSQVSLQVYDIAGRLVTTLVDGIQEAGTHSVTFDGSRLASGLYFVRMQAGNLTAVQKLMLVK